MDEENDRCRCKTVIKIEATKEPGRRSADCKLTDRSNNESRTKNIKPTRIPTPITKRIKTTAQWIRLTCKSEGGFDSPTPRSAPRCESWCQCCRSSGLEVAGTSGNNPTVDPNGCFDKWKLDISINLLTKRLERLQ